MSFRMSFKEEIPDNINGEQGGEEKEGQWRNLTNDVLALILERLNTRADLCRFRSICQSWRSFASPPQNHVFFPLSLPPLHSNSRKLSLSPTLIYIISPKDDQQQRVWLAKVAEIGDKRWDLLNPLTKEKLYFSSGLFKNRINLLGFRNLEVGRSYRLQLIDNFSEDSRFDFEDFSSSISLKKVVVNVVEDQVSVLGLNTYGEIAIWNKGDENWKIIEIGEKKENQFDEVICYDGRFFAVDRRGRLVTINPTTMELNEVVKPMEDCNGMYIYLVEANFKLYMVNKIVNPRPVNYYDDEEEEWVVDKTTVGKPLGFNVYALNEKEKSWEKVQSLKNKVLFVSRDATFSVSAEDLGWSKGNCVYFEGLTGYDDEADMRFGLNAGVYNLEYGGITTLDSVPEWTEIFWPPPRWFLGSDDYVEVEMQD
ncbi:F-box protein SKIP23-like [Silene latifolia]|uniref:F-box protein SKIP23-like n=1 Tax=Silene latifolia TaxID=37657 RepID=UPI003D777B4D